MKKYNYFLLIITLLFVGCNHSEKPKPKVDDNSTKLHPRKVEKTETSTIKPSITDTTPLNQTVSIYLNALSNFQVESIVEMTYPKLFTVINIDLFRQYMSTMFNSTDLSISNFTTNLTNLSPARYFSNGTAFAQAEYDSTITIQILNPKLYDTQEKINFLYDAFVTKYGQENVTLDVDQRVLTIKRKEKLIAIKEKENEWKFLTDNSKYRQLYPSFLPSEILNNLQ